mmetsp:Transcript_7765/g.22518  ORF Transcript_7765/g.22518 Transcript_7765/m.22518 type:complete len:206 (-) Transcript_7765:218-835(-)
MSSYSSSWYHSWADSVKLSSGSMVRISSDAANDMEMVRCAEVPVAVAVGVMVLLWVWLLLFSAAMVTPFSSFPPAAGAFPHFIFFVFLFRAVAAVSPALDLPFVVLRRRTVGDGWRCSDGGSDGCDPVASAAAARWCLRCRCLLPSLAVSRFVTSPPLLRLLFDLAIVVVVASALVSMADVGCSCVDVYGLAWLGLAWLGSTTMQ